MKSAAIKKNGVVREADLIAVADDIGLSVGTPVQLQIRVIKGGRKLDQSVFGIWKDRKDLSNPAQWVAELRLGKWRR